MKRLAGRIERGRASVAVEQRAIREHVAEVETIAATLDPTSGTPRQRRRAFGRLRRRSKPRAGAVYRRMAVVMGALVCGLFGTPGA